MSARGWPQVRRALVRPTFGESPQLLRVGIAGMPQPFWPFYRACVWMSGLYFRIASRGEVVGRENIPQGGGWMYASNHLSSADPPLIAAILLPRWVKHMAKIELFQRPVLGFLFALGGTFPVRRFRSDLGALREAQNLLAAGEIIGMFPEGHRSETRALVEAHPGTALLALRSNAPVLPVAITGSEAFRRGPLIGIQQPRVRVVIGKPFRFNHQGRITRVDVEAAQDRIMREIAALLPARYRGVYRERFADLPEKAAVDLAGSARARSA